MVGLQKFVLKVQKTRINSIAKHCRDKKVIIYSKMPNFKQLCGHKTLATVDRIAGLCEQVL